MKITKIERAKKRKNRVNIFIDDQFAFACYDEIVLKHSLSKGDEIDDDLMTKIKTDSSYFEGKHYLMNILSRKNYTESEMKSKLFKRGIKGQTALDLINEMKDIGLVNDGKYIDEYLKFLKETMKYSKMEIEGKMRLKFGRYLENEILKDGLQDYDESEVLKNLMARLKSERDEKKIINRFQRKGFSYEEIRSLLNNNKEE